MSELGWVLSESLMVLALGLEIPLRREGAIPSEHLAVRISNRWYP